MTLRRYTPLWLLAGFLLLALACEPTIPDPEGLATDAFYTATPQPTAETPGSPAVMTAAAQATQVALDNEATRTAGAAADEAAQAATETALAPIRAELATLGIDPATEGRPGWIHPPVTLEVSGPGEYDYINHFLATIAADFVIATDITWNTQFGTAGCGFIFRSNGEPESLDGYLMIASRGGNGQTAFAVLAAGEVLAPESWNAGGNLDWQNDATNHIVMVARGSRFTIYANGVEVRTFTAPDDAVYDRGFVALVALNESGTTRCQFDNTWLWLLD